MVNTVGEGCCCLFLCYRIFYNVGRRSMGDKDDACANNVKYHVLVCHNLFIYYADFAFINIDMNEDIKIKELSKKLAEQTKQIASLKTAIEGVNRRLLDTAKKQSAIKDTVRRMGLDINSIKLKLTR